MSFSSSACICTPHQTTACQRRHAFFFLFFSIPAFHQAISSTILSRFGSFLLGHLLWLPEIRLTSNSFGRTLV
jgi:hypothetical protein